MRYSTVLSLLAGASSALIFPLFESQLEDRAAVKLPFSFTPIFTATLHLSKPSNPITTFGGLLINEPVVSGPVTGSAINATIQGGFTHPPIYNYGTLQVPMIDLYGTTEDGESFYLHEEGVGTNAAQGTRIELSVGASKYKKLADGFILASINPSADRTIVSVEGFLVENTLP